VDTLSLSVKTISTYRSRVLEKLHLSSTADLVRYAIDHGLID
jgi:DNA-binding NarL/FixJ family response regulator